jgi:glycosyltransferase involved in cell wall biosynthesis
LTIIANFSGDLNIKSNFPKSVKVIDLQIRRKVNLFHDIKALYSLINVFSKNKFELVHSISPKAGLLAMSAGWLTGVPIRIHTFTGQVWASKKGYKKFFLILIDRLLSILASHILVDSFSQRQFLITNRIVKESKSTVLGRGSISGVDLEKFHINSSKRFELRKQFGVHDDVTIILFVGRLNRDKGIVELSEAYDRIQNLPNKVELWLVGPDEEGFENIFKSMNNVKFFSFVSNPEVYMAAADIFCLPSYREGFGTVIIEAAACGLPSIGSNIYGLSDAIIDGKTGLLTPVKSSKSLELALKTLITDKNLRYSMGKEANLRVKKIFPQELLTAELLKFYKKLIINNEI